MNLITAESSSFTRVPSIRLCGISDETTMKWGGGGVPGFKKKTDAVVLFLFLWDSGVKLWQEFRTVTRWDDDNPGGSYTREFLGTSSKTEEGQKFEIFEFLAARGTRLFLSKRSPARILPRWDDKGGKIPRPSCLASTENSTLHVSFTFANFLRSKKKKKLLTLSQIGTRVIFGWAIRKVGIRN